MKEAVILFYSTNHAMWASDVFKEKKITHKMISVPRELSSDCGYCIKIFEKEIKSVEEEMRNSNIEFDRIVAIYKNELI